MAKQMGGLSPLPRPQTLVEQVVTAVRGQIESRKLTPSSRLPGEVALATALGVSRPVLREALAQLKADGVLVSRKGSGLYVSEQPGGNAFRIPALGQTSENLLEALELRFYVEVAAAELAASRRTATDLAQLEATLQRMREPGTGIEGDVAFHRALAAATHNPYFVRLLELLSAQLHDLVAVSWEDPDGAARGPAVTLREHDAICRAIRKRDAQAARAAAADHLAAVARRIRVERPGAARSTKRRA